jgi:putative GTP pyrophosphokinase
MTQRAKENGYQSLHYVVRLKPGSKYKKPTPWFEIQIRTMAQEIWSEMEHILAYKSERRSNYSAKRRFQILSREIGAIDERFNLLYEELVHNQEKVQYNNEDILNNENLPIVLSEIGIRCAQQDMNTTLNMLHCRGVTTVKALLEMASMSRIETIKNTYISKLGRPPTSFELISSLGTLKKATAKDTNDIKRISSHIEFSNYWNKFRKKFREMNKNNPRTYY